MTLLKLYFSDTTPCSISAREAAQKYIVYRKMFRFQQLLRCRAYTKHRFSTGRNGRHKENYPRKLKGFKALALRWRQLV
jgi:hypothetical protein